MASTIRHITIDCRDPHGLARFWAEALGFVDDPDDPNVAGDPEAVIIDPRGLRPGLLFLPVPEDKTTKNRVHLDLLPATTRDLEVDHLLGLGATLVDDLRRGDGTGWAVLADPEGNEFCVERSETERLDEQVTERDATASVGAGPRPYPDLDAVPERAMLESMLDWYRAGVVAKVAGIAQRHAVARPLPSSTSIAGLVKHLAMVDWSWFGEDIAGQPPLAWYAGVDWDDDRDWEFHSALSEPIALQVERYTDACDRSRAIVAGRGLDDLGVNADRSAFTLRYVYLHMIEETARHLGHLDILRELLDGTTGE